MVKLALIHAVALAFAAAVQGATLVEPQGNATLIERATPCTETNTPLCQTSGGSPLVSDCNRAIQQLGTSHCKQTNSNGSHCQTITSYGTCKIDACGKHNAQTVDNIFCAYYLEKLRDTCQSNGRVGGLFQPTSCNVNPATDDYRLQFSHS
ncbi:hypothetical protein C8Q80DRAFT_1346843 [Daedaleopsis nitida]|nr:hypothetical protein C8Q80DRAFT_1346843 [Daedaleopsis nitida]